MVDRRQSQTPWSQAAFLFAVAGVLGLFTEFFVLVGSPRTPAVVLSVAALLGAVALRLAPAQRWPLGASLVAVPLAFALLGLSQRLAPGAPAAYGVWFVVVFAWIGFWHPPRTVLWAAPFGAVAYVVPFLGVSTVPATAIGSVFVVFPAGVTLGEVLATQMACLRRTQREVAEARSLLERASLTDDLTGIGNRRRANSLLDGMQPGDGLLILDLDNFKRVNDTLGHGEGDLVLSRVGAFLHEVVRGDDSVARFGGEEFVLVLRAAGHRLPEIADRLLASWRSQGCMVTMSAGGAVHHDHQSPSDTFRLADQALYAAKAAGRDQAIIDDSSPSSITSVD
ncbi:MAG: GGDEF domain-containing protein [Acidimicrobiales bacterium]|nr:GGDEF domain-containing protein [Acidimicrobiales bacterium]